MGSRAYSNTRFNTSRQCWIPPGNSNYCCFGSAHANGFHMAFCDGSVDIFNYTIDPEIHRRLGNRKDGMAIDGKKY